MAKRNWLNEILGGGFLLKSKILENTGFVLYLFFLTIAYISLTFVVEKTLLIERRNTLELKHLRSDLTSKSAKLQYLSKRAEVEKRLLNLNSTLKAPVNPPIRVLIKK